MNIIIGSDHGGYELKCVIIEYLKGLNHNVFDAGTNSREACDYPDFAFKVAERVAADPSSLGIMIDGAGIGSTMCANRVPGVLAATCNELYVTRNAREHNSANLMCIGSQVVGPGLAKKLVDVFLGTKFEGGRHVRRIDKILGYAAGAAALTESVISTVIKRVLEAVSTPGRQPAVSGADDKSVTLISEEYVKNNCSDGSTLVVKKGTPVTSLALDMARAKGVTVSFE